MELFRVQFFVEDKNVARCRRALMGIARDYHDEPVINARPNGRGGVAARTNGNGLDMLTAHLKKHRLKEITSKDLAAYNVSIGRAEGGYSYLLRQAIEARLLRRVPKTPNNAARYKVVL